MAVHGVPDWKNRVAWTASAGLFTSWALVSCGSAAEPDSAIHPNNHVTHDANELNASAMPEDVASPAGAELGEIGGYSGLPKPPPQECYDLRAAAAQQFTDGLGNLPAQCEVDADCQYVNTSDIDVCWDGCGGGYVGGPPFEAAIRALLRSESVQAPCEAFWNADCPNLAPSCPYQPVPVSFHCQSHACIPVFGQ